MAYDDIQVHRWNNASSTNVRSFPMTAAQTFNRGHLVQVVAAGTVTVLPEDDSEALVADLAESLTCGIALNGPGAAATAERPTDFLKNHPDSGDTYANTSFGPGVAVGTPRIWIAEADKGIEFRTRNTLAAGGAAAGAAPNGADRGAIFFISYGNTPTPDIGWGIEQSAATYGTQIAAKITDVLDARMRSVGPTAAGVWYVFEIKTGNS